MLRAHLDGDTNETVSKIQVIEYDQPKVRNADLPEVIDSHGCCWAADFVVGEETLPQP